MKVILAGTGCGSQGSMTGEVRDAIRQADLLIGAKRLLESIPEEVTARRAAAIYAEEILEIIRQAGAGAADCDPASKEPVICVL